MNDVAPSQVCEEVESSFVACQRVFNTPEPAEAIFLELHMLDVLEIVTQTCKQWKAIVDNSIKLQQLLFFKPISSIRLRYFEDNTEWPIPTTGIWSTSAEDLAIYKIYPHPFLSGMSDAYCTKGLNWAAIRRPEASWRLALAFQPAATEVTFDTSTHVCRNDSGVTLGELVLAGLAHGPPPESSFRREDIHGWQEFNHEEMDEPSFADLQGLFRRPHKAKKTPILWDD